MFRLLGNVEPQKSASVVNSRVQALLARFGGGEPRDRLDPTTNQLTPQSEACVQFEALYHPLDNILQGIPSWALEDDTKHKPQKDAQRREVR